MSSKGRNLWLAYTDAIVCVLFPLIGQTLFFSTVGGGGGGGGQGGGAEIERQTDRQRERDTETETERHG